MGIGRTTGNWVRGHLAAGVLAACVVLFVTAPALGGRKERVREECAVVETNLGKIVFRFFRVESPKTVEAFKRMARAGIYNGSLFHRVLPGLMIQGGDPATREGGSVADDSAEAIDLEKNDLKHRPGTVSMAHEREDLHSRVEFFICLQDVPYFDSRYTVIGEIISGLKVADAISNVPRNAKQAPLYPVKIRRLYLEEQEFLKEVK